MGAPTWHTGPMSGTGLRRGLVIAAAVVAVGACNTTVDDSGPSDEELTGGAGRELAAEDATPLESGVIVDPAAPATTVPIEGSAADLLPEIGVDMSRLSALVGTDEGAATIARIEAAWAAIRTEIEQTRPDLLNGIQATVDMARTAVDANRPADADKAFSLLNDLIDSFTGDS